MGTNMRNFDHVPGRWQGRRIKFYRNGDARFKGKPLVVNLYHFRTIDALCEELTSKLTPDFGMVRKIYTPQGGTALSDVQNVLHPAVDASKRGLVVAGGKGSFVRIPGGYGGLDYTDRKTGENDLSRPFSADDIDEARREAVRTSMSKRAYREDLPPRTAKRSVSESNAEEVTIQVYRNGFPEEPLRAVAVKRGKLQMTLGRLYRLDGTPVVKGRDIQENGIYVVAEKGERFLPRSYQHTQNFDERQGGRSSRWQSRAPSRAQSEYQSSSQTAAKNARSVSESQADETSIQVYRNGFPDEPSKTVKVSRSKFQSTLGRLYRLDGTPVVRGKEIQENGVYVVAQRGEHFLKRNYIGGAINVAVDAKAQARASENPAARNAKSKQSRVGNKTTEKKKKVTQEPEPSSQQNKESHKKAVSDEDDEDELEAHGGKKVQKSILKPMEPAYKSHTMPSNNSTAYDDDNNGDTYRSSQSAGYDGDDDELYDSQPQSKPREKSQSASRSGNKAGTNLSPPEGEDDDDYGDYSTRRRDMDSAYQSDYGEDFRLQSNSAGVYNAKKRAGKHIFDEDYEEKSLFKAKTPNTMTAGAAPVRESRKATLEMPVDYYKAEIVHEELTY